jgi:flavin-dependent dehydrogenase
MAGAIDALRSSYDAVIVGARCAGAATAMLLARAGLHVLVVEQAARGSDTLSTLALMRAGVLQLSRWGLLDAIRAAGTPRIERTTFHYGDHAVEIRIKSRDGVDALYAPRRTLLDPLLADAANGSGAEVAYRVRVTDLQRDVQGRVKGVVVESGGLARPIAATMVIGADGVNSTVAKRVGAEPYRVGPHMSSVIYTRASGLDIEGYHWHYAPGVSASVIPTNDGETLVFAAATRQRFMRELRFDLAAGFHNVLRETSPSLAATMRGAAAGSFRGFAGHQGILRPAWGPGWALVGDAGYFKDPITAHGITDALRDAELLARAVLRGTDEALVAYQTVRDQLSVPLFTITDEIASFAWDIPRLQALHKSLSDEMAREVLHVVDGGAEDAALGHDHGGARPSLQPAHWRLQPATR